MYNVSHKDNMFYNFDSDTSIFNINDLASWARRAIGANKNEK